MGRGLIDVATTLRAVVPFALLDAWVSLYQVICFRWYAGFVPYGDPEGCRAGLPSLRDKLRM